MLVTQLLIYLCLLTYAMLVAYIPMLVITYLYAYACTTHGWLLTYLRMLGCLLIYLCLVTYLCLVVCLVTYACTTDAWLLTYLLTYACACTTDAWLLLGYIPMLVLRMLG
jgi:hypothetical protein